jgi:menaquinone-dependent protoporphyrinogen oxidase
MRVLVAYATKRGSTREVAQAVMSVLLDRGLEVDFRPAAEVEDVADYDAVVLGGALYIGRWHADARRFIHRHRDELGERPFAVFGLGPRTLEPKEVEESRSQLTRALAKTPGLRPESVAVFGGVVDPAQFHFPLTHLPASDARDWDAIEAWAADVATRLIASPHPVTLT